MQHCKPIATPAEPGLKLNVDSTSEPVNPTLFKSIAGSLRYLTISRPDIMYAVGSVSRFMEKPKQDHWSAAKRILRYIKGTEDHGLFYTYNKNQDWLVTQTVIMGETWMIGKEDPVIYFILARQHFRGHQRNNKLLLFQLVRQNT